jgi:rhodanese-related sulfurtransferase
MTFSGIDEMLAHARSTLRRLAPREVWEAWEAGGVLVDTRPEFQRREAGEIPGAIVIERNHLEWRLDPRCAARIPEATSPDVHWILICAQGYSSSLAAAALQDLGLVNATDVIGGVEAWLAAGLPTVRPAVPTVPRGPGDAGVPCPGGRSGADQHGGQHEAERQAS